MSAEAVDALRTALRRSVPLIAGFVLLGAIALNVFTNQREPRYEDTARVLIDTTPLANIVTGTQPSFVDPSRQQQTAVGIAGSQDVYDLAVEAAGADIGTPSEVRGATEVVAEENSDLINFSASASTATIATARANAVANGYVLFRTRLGRAQIDDTIAGLQGGLRGLGPSDPRRAELEATLGELRVLRENTADARVIQRAESADKTSPAPVRDTLLGASIGLVIALLVVAGRELVDTTVRRESDVEEALPGISVLAIVKQLPRRARRDSRSRLVTAGPKRAEFADSYGLLAAQLLQARRSKVAPWSIAVTSAGIEEGKTSTCANLAMTLARRGHRVVLADFDFRKPSVGGLFGLEDAPKGSIWSLQDGAELEAALHPVRLDDGRPDRPDSAKADRAHDWGFEGGTNGGSLRVMPAGGRSRTAPDREQMKRLVHRLKGTCDIVIIDTPPALLTVEVTELSSAVDGVLVVVRAGRATRRGLQMLERQASTWSAPIVGAVLTGIRLTRNYTYYGDR